MLIRFKGDAPVTGPFKKYVKKKKGPEGEKPQDCTLILAGSTVAASRESPRSQNQGKRDSTRRCTAITNVETAWSWRWGVSGGGGGGVQNLCFDALVNDLTREQLVNKQGTRCQSRP